MNDLINHQENGYHSANCPCTTCTKWKASQQVEITFTVRSPGRGKGFTVAKKNLPVGYFDDLKRDVEEAFETVLKKHEARFKE